MARCTAEHGARLLPTAPLSSSCTHNHHPIPPLPCNIGTLSYSYSRFPGPVPRPCGAPPIGAAPPQVALSPSPTSARPHSGPTSRHH